MIVHYIVLLYRITTCTHVHTHTHGYRHTSVGRCNTRVSRVPGEAAQGLVFSRFIKGGAVETGCSDLYDVIY